MGLVPLIGKALVNILWRNTRDRFRKDEPRAILRSNHANRSTIVPILSDMCIDSDAGTHSFSKLWY